MNIKDVFNSIKSATTMMTKKEQEDMLVRLSALAASAKKTGQDSMLSSLKLQYQWSTREIEEIVPAGYSQFINIDALQDAIEVLNEDQTRRVVLTDISRYMNPIPEKEADEIEKAKEVFDKVLILHTDFSGKHRKATEEVRKEKDPISFGVLTGEINSRTVLNPHYYIINDWEDEYCDLTLARLVDEYKDITGKDLSVSEALESLSLTFKEDE